MRDIRELVLSFWDKMVEYRRWLHAHPELSGQEKETAAFIAATLRSMGLEPYENVGGYGVTALIHGSAPGKCVGLRADFDALPIPECTGLSFASENAGVSHSCGHDLHTAMLLGAAHVLMELRGSFAGTVKLIFQPSEENSAESGAKRMIGDGVLENPHVDAIFGQHISPLCPIGKITVRPGAMSAASDRFFITVEGKSSHASKPETGVDAVVVGAQVVSALQSIVSRSVSPLDNSVLTIGTLKAGTRYNVLAESCEMEGTCRNQNMLVRESMPARMESIVRGVTEGMGAGYSFRYMKGYAPVINDAEMYRLLADTAAERIGAENVVPMEHASLGGEDFCFYAQQVPGAFYHLGCQKEGEAFWPLHNGHLDPDENAMKIGAEVMVASALRFLESEVV
ncbi:MAG: amidohydrolase [Oscillospiraceae bacterium]|nr:amidohydrolase [Oscillospiraceae bacterium]